MADVAELGVKLEAHGDAQVVAALNRVERAVQGTHQSTLQLGAAIGTASAAATAAFGVIANAAQAAFGSVGESVVGMNSRLEQSSIAFTTLLGSAERTDAFLKDLQQFAAQTPFEFPELQDASKRMLAFGFQSQQVIPLLTAVGNAAAAMGSGKEGIDRITTALGQMQAKGKASAEEMMQLTEAGIPAWDMLAKKLGTDVAGAMDAVSKRTVDANTVITAFTEGSAARFGGMMEAQAHTFAGAMSTIKDVVGQLVGGAFKPFFDVLSGLADRLAQFAQSETVSVWAQDLQIKLGALGPMFSDLGAWLEAQLPAAMSAAEAAVGGFVAVVQDLGPRLADLAQTVGPLLAEGWDRLTGVLGAVGTAFAAMAPTLSTVFGAVQTLSSAVNDQLGAALSGLGGQLDTLGTTLGNIGAALSTALGGSGTGALDALGTAAGVLGAALDALGTVASTAFQSLQIAMVDAANVVIPQLAALATWLGETLPPVLAEWQAHWDDFWGNAGPVIVAFWGVAQPVLAAFAGILTSVVIVSLQAFATVVGEVFASVKRAFDGLGIILNAIGDVIGGPLHDLGIALRVALRDATPQVTAQAQEMGESVKNAIVQGAAPAAQEVTEAVEPAAQAITKVGTSANAAAPAVASLGTAGTTAAAGLSTASKEAKTLDEVMSDLAKSTTPEAVQQALLYQNANAALAEALRSLDAETAAQVLAMKNAGDVYGAARTALLALGATNDEAAAAVHGLASAHDVLAEAAYRATGALRAEQAAGAAASGSAMGAPANNTGGGGVGAVGNAWDAMYRRMVEGAQPAGQQAGQALSTGVQRGVQAAMPALSTAVHSAVGGALQAVATTIAADGPDFFRGALTGPYLQAHPEAANARPVDYAAGNAARTSVLANGGSYLEGQEAASRATLASFSERLIDQAQRFMRASFEEVTAHIRDKITEVLSHAGETLAQRETRVTGVPTIQTNIDNTASGLARQALTAIEATMTIQQAAQLEYTAQLQGAGAALGTLGRSIDTTMTAEEALAEATDGLTGATRVQHTTRAEVTAAENEAARAVYHLTTGTGLAARAISSMPGNIESWAMSIDDILKAEQQYVQALQANAQALRTNTTVIAGQVIGQGLTYGQIYGNTGTNGGGNAGGSNQSILNVNPGNYYGIPIVSPLTGGTLRGFADGGWVTEPVVGRGLRSGAGYAFGERGPEFVSPGGATTVQVVVNVNGADALRDPRLYEQMLDRGLTQAMQKRKLVAR